MILSAVVPASKTTEDSYKPTVQRSPINPPFILSISKSLYTNNTIKYYEFFYPLGIAASQKEEQQDWK
jgi:hypothetical protein